MFGVIHHIPSFELRKKLITEAYTHLKKGGLLIFTNWLFLHDSSLKKRVINPEDVGIIPAQLESNDYILDWQRGTFGIRYCHLVDESELSQLLESLPPPDTFIADGKEGTLNRYVVITKI